MKFYFHTHYAKELCLQYMQNKNVNDIFEYKWEYKYGQWFITFIEYARNSLRSLGNCPKPTFMVIFKETPEGTDIEVEYIEDIPIMFVDYKEVHQFWETKLDAVLIREDTW